MRRIIGIGETIYDIIFKENRPVKAVPGGSTFNCMVSLGRLGFPALFISESGNDKVGKIIKDFMGENNLSTDYIDFFEGGNSPVALAFLDANQDAEYTFYRNFPESRLNIDFPDVKANDIVIFGSYFALNPVLRERVSQFLCRAKEQNALIYYDINFRKAHVHERLKLTLSFLENFEYVDIIRCSIEDLETLYPGETVDAIYRNRIFFYTKNFIVTQGVQNVLLKTARFEKQYEVKPLVPVSTIGAGDNFNAGLVYGMMKYGYSRENLNRLEEEDWDKVIALAIRLASEVCMSPDNYISKEFASQVLLSCMTS